ncbi:MAG TPA: metallophosphoesterase [Thermaerobacter sp.]
MSPGPVMGLVLTGLWLAWVAGVEPRWLQVRAYRLRPGAGPHPIPPPAAARARLPSGHPAPAGDRGEESDGKGRVLRVAHLTDLHAPFYRIDEIRLLAALQAWGPDLIAFTGDLADSGQAPYEAGLRLLARLSARWPVYFVPGNHDHPAGWPALERRLREAGIRVLVNEGDSFQIRGRTFYIAGVDDPHTGRDRLERALGDAPAGVPVLLLAHAPTERIRRLASQRGIPLVLVGHTHGGQVRLPGLGALWVPGQGWFPRYDRGWFRLGDGHLLVNAGLGTPKPWIRWLCPPEVVLIEWEPGP